jgi:hypothetical protein
MKQRFRAAILPGPGWTRYPLFYQKDNQKDNAFFSDLRKKAPKKFGVRGARGGRPGAATLGGI